METLTIPQVRKLAVVVQLFLWKPCVIQDVVEESTMTYGTNSVVMGSSMIMILTYINVVVINHMILGLGPAVEPQFMTSWADVVEMMSMTQ
jgi:hypothetical protein